MNNETLIVSMTTYPARMQYQIQVWNSILQWKMDKNVHFVITLCTLEFPEETKAKFQNIFNFYKENDIEVLWINKNIRSFKKFFPVCEIYKQHDILVIDDDILRDADDFLEIFLLYRKNYPNEILARHIPHFINSGLRLRFFNTTSVRHNDIIGTKFLTAKPSNGLGGVLYPADFFNNITEEIVYNWYDIVPTSDETCLWMWGAINNYWTRQIVPLSKDTLLYGIIKESQQTEETLCHFQNYNANFAMLNKRLNFYEKLLDVLLDNIKICETEDDYLKESDKILIFMPESLNYADFIKLLYKHLDNLGNEVMYKGAKIRTSGNYNITELKRLEL